MDDQWVMNLKWDFNIEGTEDTEKRKLGASGGGLLWDTTVVGFEGGDFFVGGEIFLGVEAGCVGYFATAVGARKEVRSVYCRIGIPTVSRPDSICCLSIKK
jgi:hypothetical protein